MDIDAWWAANPQKRGRAAAAILLIWIGGLAIGLISVAIDASTSIQHDFAFLTRPNDTSSMSNYHFTISPTEYQRYLNMNHSIVYLGDYARFCDSTGLYPIAKQIKDSCGAATNEKILNALLSFVQHKSIPNSVHYALDPAAIEYPKYPLETLGNGSGDCEDLAILFASLAEVLGYETVLVLSTGHAFAAVHMYTPPVMAKSNLLTPFTYGNRIYYPCECTSYGWRVGELSVPWDEVQGALDVSIVDPVGIAVVSWVLPVSAGVVVVVIGLVVRKKNKRMTSNVNNP